MFRVLVLGLFFFGLNVGCTEAENSDGASIGGELSCSTATGQWVITGATCDGVPNIESDLIIFGFNSVTSVTQLQGGSSCQTSIPWDTVIDATNNSISFSGNGNLSCTADGSPTNSCSTTLNNCDSTFDVTGFQNNFDQCVISGTSMSLTRVVSSTTNPNGLSFCADGQTEVIALTQSSSDPSGAGVLSLSGSDPLDFGTVNVGSHNALTLTLTNEGSEEVTGLSADTVTAPFEYLGGSYPGTGGDCATSLAGGSTCSLVVNFAPTAAGTFTNTLILNYTNSLGAQVFGRVMNGTGSTGGGGNAVLVISESNPYDYGNVQNGMNSPHTFTVTNVGGGNANSIFGLTAAPPFSFFGGSYPGTGGTCAVTLAAAASCTIVFNFSPTANGLFTDTIRLSYNDGSTSQMATRDVQGTGTP
jgi:hypothetical protein